MKAEISIPLDTTLTDVSVKVSKRLSFHDLFAVSLTFDVYGGAPGEDYTIRIEGMTAGMLKTLSQAIQKGIKE